MKVTMSILSLVGCLCAFGQNAPPESALFPTPFVAEHVRLETGSEGDVKEFLKVTDYYGGSWLVSVGEAGRRTIIDFARSEIREVDTHKGVYTILSFARLAELNRRMARAELILRGEREGSNKTTPEKNRAGHIVVEEVPPENRTGAAPSDVHSGLLTRPAVKHVRAYAETAGAARSAESAVDVWLDPSVTLAPQARAAIARFEQEVLASAVRADRTTSSSLIAAAREWGNGAFTIRTQKIVSDGLPGSPAVHVTNLYTRLQTIAVFPYELLAIPENMRRTSHPLESLVAHTEEEAEEAQRALDATKVGLQ